MPKLKRTLIIVASCVGGVLLVAFLAVLLLLWPFLFGEWNSDFYLPLGNGYYIFRTNASTCDISPIAYSDADPRIPPNIFQAEFHGSIVIGQARMTPKSSVKSVGGYFVFDIENKVAHYALKKDEWVKLLTEEYGINNYDLRLPHEAYQDWKNKEIDHQE